MGNAIGPDVSFYQDDIEKPGHIDFKKMGKTADFVIIRAGQNLWVDRDFKLNWAAAKLAGLPRGCYWFYDSRADPKRQAELWVETMAGDFGELPLFADFEEAYGGPYRGWRKWFDFLERLKELVGDKEIAIYTAFYYWRDNAPNPSSNLDYFGQYPLWIANYGAPKPSVPKPWGPDEWLFWQFTEVGDGKLYGVESKGIDLNYFNGDAEAFRQRFSLSDPGETPPDGQDGIKYCVELSIRANPGIEEDVISMLEQDEVVEIIKSSPDGNWTHIKRANGATGWIYKTHLIEIVTVPPEPPAPPEPPTSEDKWYRVTANALNVRDGPSTGYNKIGQVKNGEVVKAIKYGGAAPHIWIKIIRKSDGLTGWCYASYLEETTAPPDTGEPPDIDDQWYRVTAFALNIREGPGIKYSIIKALKQNDIVQALETNADGSWIKIKRESDGLTGWCSASYLKKV